MHILLPKTRSSPNLGIVACMSRIYTAFGLAMKLLKLLESVGWKMGGTDFEGTAYQSNNPTRIRKVASSLG